ERIERPGFLILAPAFYFYDQYSLFTGNPSIIPTIARRLKFDFRFGTINNSFLFTKYEDPVFHLQPDLNEDLELYITRPLQAEIGHTFSFSSSAPFQLFKSLNSRINFNANLIDQRPVIEGQTLKNTNFNYNILWTNSFTLPSNIELEANAQYYSKFVYAAAFIKSRWSIDFGVRKKFPKGQILAFNVIDVFNTLSQWDVDYDAGPANIRYQGIFDQEGPIYRASFSFPFGNTNLKRKSKRTSRSAEEQQRLN
ncbi:MAG: outer membrane beta-barrel protein, partial [Bacteroidota bacterium]